jgi:thioredoxin reductase (NADPH)
MARGPVLRGFDGGMSDRIVRHMAATGTHFKRGAAPVRVAPEGTRVDPETGAELPRYRVWWRSTAQAAGGDGGGEQLQSDVFDTVVFATGRAPSTGGLGLAEAGVRLDASGKVVGGHGGAHVDGGATKAAPGASGGGSSSIGSVLQSRDVSRSIYSETSSVPSVHAVGDVLAGRPELTPVAIRAGKLLAQRLMRGVLPTEGAAPQQLPPHASSSSPSSSPLVMDYALVPTTVFTPLEYGAVGLSEEEAAAAFGADGIDVYHSAYDTLELSVAHRADADGLPLPPQCYTKMVVTRADSSHGERVLGLHVLGPHAGEVVQGFATALRLGATRADLEATIGIHPTHAEEVVGLDTTKRSGGDFLKTSC